MGQLSGPQTNLMTKGWTDYTFAYIIQHTPLDSNSSILVEFSLDYAFTLGKFKSVV